MNPPATPAPAKGTRTPNDAAMPSPPASERHPAALRALQTLWGALAGGVFLMTAILGGLAVADGAAGGVAGTEMVFYGNAALNMAAIAAAFALQRRGLDRVAAAPDDEAALAALRSYGLGSVAAMEASALLANVAAYLTGDLANALFVVPFFAFVGLFFPTRARFDAWMALAGLDRR